MSEALILVDIQYDFLKDGSLEVPYANEILAVVGDLIEKFEMVVATQDYHPSNHESFASMHPGKNIGEVIELHGLTQVLWPDHCVQGTRGCELYEGLNLGRIQKIFVKGVDPTTDSYSGFFDNGRRHSTGLSEYLKENGIVRLYIVGLATDYCVKFTVLDALTEGFEVVLIPEGIRAVDLNEGDGDRAIDEMQRAGAILKSVKEL